MFVYQECLLYKGCYKDFSKLKKYNIQELIMRPAEQQEVSHKLPTTSTL